MSQNDIKVLPASPHDAISLELIAELSAELGAMYGNDGSGAFRPDDVTVPRAGFVVAWSGDDAVGCGALRPMKHDPQTAEIKRMYVRPAFRGKGVSKQILAALENLARENGYQMVCLETGIQQGAALGLYDAAGYSRRDCYEAYGNDPNSICFEKTL